MEFFSDQLILLLPLAGFDLFRRTTASSGPTSVFGAGDVLFTFSTAGATATGRETDDSFVVLAGSTARRSPTGTFPRGYLALREQLVADGKLVVGPTSDLYTFAADVAFSSPSAAASIVAARSASGPREWRAKETGKLYGEWRAVRLDE